MAIHEISLDLAARELGKNLLKSVEDAFYEQLKPQIEAIARTSARNLARNLRGHIHYRYNYEKFGQPEIILQFNSEELGFD